MERSAVRSVMVMVSFQVALTSIHQRAYRHQIFLCGGFHSSGGLSPLERLDDALTAMSWGCLRSLAKRTRRFLVQ